MRAVKAIAIICALLSLACLVGGIIVALQLFATAHEAMLELQRLPQALSGVSPLELGDHIQSALSGSAAILTSAVAESQPLLLLLFGGAVVLLLITIVLVVALRPERRTKGQGYYDYNAGY
ncbi:hypothetical protein LJC60_07960 [Ruminococcaceae bacterium OttesenSCG-928-D13]|nr:hypothetical protein [Ruminococcaceae bacterium OttesenSCG-928-D13]